MDSLLAWLTLLFATGFGLYAFALAALAELERKARESEADWIRLETEWGR